MIAEEDAAIRSVGIGRRMQWTFASDGEKGLRTGPHAKRRFFLPLPLLMQCLLTSLFFSSFLSFPFSLFTYS